ncbi:ribonuclease H [Senna tora]|uniref:Ribonuclease H n=1 Tax=Senna tora TaxID=362788 RepID=A0A834TJP6_9FABA|nr:ribonuclease H [Senna tora]
MGYQPSYTWRSILSARWVLEKGAIWKVGNGTQIRIWEDRWLHGPHCYRLLQPQQLDSELQWVSDLIDHDTRTWRHDLLSTQFNEVDASNIFGVPLSMCNDDDDELIWPFTKHNCYSVKSVYHFITEQHSVSEFLDWLIDRILHNCQEVIEWIAVICWVIWAGSNALLFDNITYLLQESVLKVQLLFKELNIFSADLGSISSSSSQTNHSRQSSRWQCPHLFHMKLNTDVAKLSENE